MNTDKIVPIAAAVALAFTGTSLVREVLADEQDEGFLIARDCAFKESLVDPETNNIFVSYFVDGDDTDFWNCAENWCDSLYDGPYLALCLLGAQDFDDTYGYANFNARDIFETGYEFGYAHAHEQCPNAIGDDVSEDVDAYTRECSGAAGPLSWYEYFYLLDGGGTATTFEAQMESHLFAHGALLYLYDWRICLEETECNEAQEPAFFFDWMH